MLDLHTHILPRLDDGTRDLEEAVELAIESARNGVEVIAATPHVRDDWPTTAAQIETGVLELQAELDRRDVAVRVIHGAELDLAAAWELGPEELRRFTYAQNGRYVLLESPYRGWPPAIETTVRTLLGRGMTPVLAHPERNPEVQDRPQLVAELVELGALAQVTVSSLADRAGPAARVAGERLLALGAVHVLASDSHGPHIRRGSLALASEVIPDPALREYLTREAPAAVVAGEDVPAAPQVRLSAGT